MDDRKITVAVCGDSFCSGSVKELAVTGAGIRAHFSQMLEDRYGYHVLYLAHSGFSNLGILFQIREALLLNADVVLYATTWSNRITLAMTNKFHLDSGIKNFRYFDNENVSSSMPYTGDNNAPLLSTTHWNIGNSPFFTVTPEQKMAIDLYHKHLYEPWLHDTIDEWLFDYWHQRIVAQGALPIRFKDKDIGKIAYDFSQANPTFDTPFHTDRATQEQIADNVHRRIVDNLAQ